MRLTTGVTAALAFAWAVLMIKLFSYPPHPRFHHNIDSPVVAIELASTPKEAQDVLRNASEISAIHLNTALDLIFIPLYAGYLLIAALFFGAKTRKAKVAVLLLVAAVAAADYAEDYYMFQNLHASTPHQFIPSLVKWIAFAIMLAIVGLAMLQPRPPLRPALVQRILAIAHLVAAASILLGLLFGRWIALGYRPVEAGGGLFGVVLALNAIWLLLQRNQRAAMPA